MFSFLGLRNNKKTTNEKEVDGGFVMIGETGEEQRRKKPSTNSLYPSTNVMVQPAKSPSTAPVQHGGREFPRAPAGTPGPVAEPPPSASEPSGAPPDVLGDVPFALAPHVLSLQSSGLQLVPEVLLSRDINYNLVQFQYDFTLENSVLHSSA